MYGLLRTTRFVVKFQGNSGLQRTSTVQPSVANYGPDVSIDAIISDIVLS